MLPGRYFIEEFGRVLAFLFTVGFKLDAHPVFIALFRIHCGPYHLSLHDHRFLIRYYQFEHHFGAGIERIIA
ncbi:MAG: hypothetical protein A2V87_06725 [Deltaproteobacteria bacterium RBG_16_58_17]|nr:MAG: hypothetical protein A2V87_06725 [Deltaproteobacteria bacterium RBG_16_58_17]OHE18323.1 MAG: hypothetical protein A2X96_12755 [Syntrophobacterales bacterium GWC2_56_13]OHE19178.1 MAG: hypothetical protein A2X95_04960 [Syntrophobacterales bacterium GWF2_56_9]